jgi:hypothetical protein
MGISIDFRILEPQLDSDNGVLMLKSAKKREKAVLVPGWRWPKI